MLMLIIVFAVSTLTIGLWFGLFISADYHGIGRAILTIVVAILMGLIFTYVGTNDIRQDTKNWNDGYCNNCGNSWTLLNVSKNSGNTTYFYTCDNCGSLIETTQFFSNQP